MDNGHREPDILKYSFRKIEMYLEAIIQLREQQQKEYDESQKDSGKSVPKDGKSANDLYKDMTAMSKG